MEFWLIGGIKLGQSQGQKINPVILLIKILIYM